jgi:hypothetical protein
MTAKAYPLQWPDGWPRTPPHLRQWSRFKITPDRAVARLFDEIRKLGGRNVVLSSNARVSRHGSPYADEMKRQTNDPGVAVYFTLDKSSIVMARDTFPMIWENVMSISHAIEHMRGLSRHGGDHMMKKAFSGFAALPAPEHVKPKRPWWEVFGLPQEMNDRGVTEAAYKMLIKKRHPDMGGSTEAFIELQEAREEAIANAK